MLGVPSTWLPGRPFSMSKSFKINALKKSRRGKLRLESAADSGNHLSWTTGFARANEALASLVTEVPAWA